MNIRRSLLYLTLSMLSLGAIGCAPHSRSGPREDPALEYVKQLRGMTQEQGRVDTRSPMSQGAEVSWASDVSGTHGAPRAAFDGRSNMAPYGAMLLRPSNAARGAPCVPDTSLAQDTSAPCDMGDLVSTRPCS